MKLAMITTYATPRNVRRELLETIARRHHSIVVISPESSAIMAAPLSEIPATYREWPVGRIGIHPMADLRSARHLYKILREERPDVVLAYQVKAIMLAPITAMLARVPRVVALVNGLGLLFDDDGFGATWKARVARTAYGVSLRAVDELVFHNRDLSLQLRDMRVLPSSSRTRVVLGSGVDLAALTAQPPHFAPPTFTMVSRLLRAKGVQEFVDAARAVRARHPDARFRLVGQLEHDDHPDGVRRADVERWVAEGVVDYLGFTDDIAGVLAATTVFVLPSYREGLPRTNLEALAAGRPVITTDAVGCRETVVDGVNGFLVPVRDSIALAERIERYLRDPALVVAHGGASRALAERKFDINHINEMMCDALGLSSSALSANVL